MFDKYRIWMGSWRARVVLQAQGDNAAAARRRRRPLVISPASSEGANCCHDPGKGVSDPNDLSGIEPRTTRGASDYSVADEAIVSHTGVNRFQN